LKKKLSFTAKTLIAIILGAVVGLVLSNFPDIQNIIKELDKQLFVHFERLLFIVIYAIVVPLVFFSIAHAMIGIGDPKRLRRIGGKSIALYLILMTVAVTIALLLASNNPFLKDNAKNKKLEDNIIQEIKGIVSKSIDSIEKELGDNIEEKMAGNISKSIKDEVKDIVSESINSIDELKENIFSDNRDREELINNISENILEKVLVSEPEFQNEPSVIMLPIVVFALFFGIGIALLGEKVSRVKEFIEQGNEVMIKLVDFMIQAVPYIGFFLIARAIGIEGNSFIGSVSWYMLTVILALLLHMFITYTILLIVFAKMNPIFFLRGIFPVIEVAFMTSSSAATLPVTMDCAERNLKVPKLISKFALPLGATISMDGTAIMQGVATVFLAEHYEKSLGFDQYLLIILMVLLASIAAAAVPSGGMVTLAIVLDVIGLTPGEIATGIVLVLSVDRLLDMSRTVTNVTGDLVVACVVASGEDKGKEKQENNNSPTYVSGSKRIELKKPH
jgi:Na+/H+-dicarboxylate symporter